MQEPDPRPSEWAPEPAAPPQPTALEKAISAELECDEWTAEDTEDWHVGNGPLQLEANLSDFDAALPAHRELYGAREKQARYLAVLSKTASSRIACRGAGVRKQEIYRWRKERWFTDAERRAAEEAGELLIASAMQYAIEGRLEPVFQGGTCVGYRRVFSEKLHIELLRAFASEKFARKEHQPTQTNNTVVLGSPEQVAEVVRRLSPTSRPALPPPSGPTV